MILLALALAAAQPPKPKVEFVRDTAPISVQLQGVPTASLVTMLLRDVMRVPYALSADVVANRRPVAVNLIIPRNDIPRTVVTYLRKSGFRVELVGGTVYVAQGSGGAVAWQPQVSSLADSSVPSGSPLGIPIAGLPSVRPARPSGNPPLSPQDVPPARFGSRSPSEPRSSSGGAVGGILAYSPAYRDTAYLASILSPVLPELKVGSRNGPEANRDRENISEAAAPDVLVMRGVQDDLRQARKLLDAIDIPRQLVAVKATIVQVSNTVSRGSALSILAKIGKGKVAVSSFADDPPASQFVRLATGTLSAILSVVREDSRFKVVATPNLTALSGAVAKMNSGKQVPTLGALQLQGDGQGPVQSVSYRDSGVTLEIRPTVRGQLIELEVKEERSTFERTTTGVADSPTLNKSAAAAQVLLSSGESVVLAGLTEASEGSSREGFLGGLLGSRDRDKAESELLVILQAELVAMPPTRHGTFVLIPDAPGGDARRASGGGHPPTDSPSEAPKDAGAAPSPVHDEPTA